MGETETDYLVIGGGASMAFVDALIAQSDVDVVMIDRRHRPGGHWLDAYPFVRIHQTSANYGVDSLDPGNNRIDATGPNAGFYERATADEICDYFNRVLSGVVARGAEPDIAAWNEACRMNPARGAMEHMDDPRVPEAFGSLAANIAPAMSNLERLARTAAPV